MVIKVFLLLLCLPRGKGEPGVGCDTGLLEAKQNGCKRPFRAQGTRVDSGKC